MQETMTKIRKTKTEKSNRLKKIGPFDFFNVFG